MTSVNYILGMNQIRQLQTTDGAEAQFISVGHVNTAKIVFACKWCGGRKPYSTCELSRKNDLLTNLARRTACLPPRASCLVFFLLCGTEGCGGIMPGCCWGFIICSSIFEESCWQLLAALKNYSQLLKKNRVTPLCFTIFQEPSNHQIIISLQNFLPLHDLAMCLYSN